MLLALDTSTRQISLALHDGWIVAAEHSWRTADYHTVELAPHAALTLRRAGIEPGQLAGVAVALGPGSYTGLRIGLALAKGLALAHNLPLIGVQTFEILTRAQPPREGRRLLAVLPAGRGRVWMASYRWQTPPGTWRSAGAARLLDWEGLAFEIGSDGFICGELEAAVVERLGKQRPGEEIFASPAQGLRRAAYLAEIGWERLRAGQVDDPSKLAPIYGTRPEGGES